MADKQHTRLSLSRSSSLHQAVKLNSQKTSHVAPTLSRAEAEPLLLQHTCLTRAANLQPGSRSEALDPELAIRFNQESPVQHLRTLDDPLLNQGIADYTIFPDSQLGKGRFSTVYLCVKGKQRFALKHTPLGSHHPLIATRLLRESTILAQLPPHPNLVKVYETIRTPGHFYLIGKVFGSALEHCA